MLIHKLTCPACGAVSKSAAGIPEGKTVACPKCKSPFKAVDDEEPITAIVVDDDEEDEPAIRPKPKRPSVPVKAVQQPTRRPSRDEEDEEDDEEEEDTPKRKKKGKKASAKPSGLSVRNYISIGLLLVALVAVAIVWTTRQEKLKATKAEPTAAIADGRDVDPPVRETITPVSPNGNPQGNPKAWQPAPAPSGNQISDVRLNQAKQLSSVRMSADARWIAGNFVFNNRSQVFGIWDIRSGKMVNHEALKLSLNIASFSPDGKQAALIGLSKQSGLNILELPSGKLLRHVELVTEDVGGTMPQLCEFTADGKEVVTIMRKQLIRVNVATGKVRIHPSPIDTVYNAFSPMAGLAADIPYEDVRKNKIRLFDIANDTPPRVLPVEGNFNSGIKFSGDGKMFGVVGRDIEPNMAINLYNVETGAKNYGIRFPNVQPPAFKYFGFSINQDGSMVAVIGTTVSGNSIIGSINLYDQSGKVIRTIGDKTVSTMLGFDATGENLWYMHTQGGVVKHNIVTGEETKF